MKFRNVFAALLLAGCLTLSFTACSVTMEKPLSMDVTQALEDYVEQQLAGAEEDSQDDGMSLDISVEGNTLVYTYTSETQLDNSDGSVTSGLDTGAAVNERIFQAVVEQVAQDIHQQDVQLRIVYLNADEEELASYTYSSLEEEE